MEVLCHSKINYHITEWTVWEANIIQKKKGKKNSNKFDVWSSYINKFNIIIS